MNGKDLIRNILIEIETMRDIEHKSLKDVIALKKPHTQVILTKETKERLENEENKIRRSVEVLDEAITRISLIAEEYKNEK